VFINNPFSETNGHAGLAYSGNIATNASDPNPGDTLSFAKVSGPAWLAVAGNGGFSGTPQSGDVGTNTFTVSVTDYLRLSSTGRLTITVTSAQPLTGAVTLVGGNLLL